MKQDAYKSKTDPRKLLVFSFVCAFLLITNVTGWNRTIYANMDQVLSPFMVVTRGFGYNTRTLFQEIGNKSGVLKQNLDLRRQIVGFEQLQAENKDLKDQIKRLEAQTNVSAAREHKLAIVRVVGAQNLYASNPELLVYLDKDYNLKQWDVVYYESNTLFGFVKEIEGRTARIVPFYSPEIRFNIPVQNLRDTTQKGFVNPINNSEITIRNVSKDVTVSEGDMWVTTNDVTDVPSSLVVGKIASVERDSQESFLKLELEVPFDLAETTYLFIHE